MIIKPVINETTVMSLLQGESHLKKMMDANIFEPVRGLSDLVRNTALITNGQMVVDVFDRYGVLVIGSVVLQEQLKDQQIQGLTLMGDFHIGTGEDYVYSVWNVGLNTNGQTIYISKVQMALSPFDNEVSEIIELRKVQRLITSHRLSIINTPFSEPLETYYVDGVCVLNMEGLRSKEALVIKKIEDIKADVARKVATYDQNIR